MPEEAMAIMVETKYFQVWHKIDRVLMAYPDHHTQEVILNVNDLKEEKATWSIKTLYFLERPLLMKFFRSQDTFINNLHNNKYNFELSPQPIQKPLQQP